MRTLALALLLTGCATQTATPDAYAPCNMLDIQALLEDWSEKPGTMIAICGNQVIVK